MWKRLPWGPFISLYAMGVIPALAAGICVAARYTPVRPHSTGRSDRQAGICVAANYAPDRQTLVQFRHWTY